MRFARLLTETADPPCPPIVGAMLPERVMHSLYRTQCKLGATLIACRTSNPQEVAHRERISPQIALLFALGGKPRAPSESHHQPKGFRDAQIRSTSCGTSSRHVRQSIHARIAISSASPSSLRRACSDLSQP